MHHPRCARQITGLIGIGVGVTLDYAIAQRLYPKLGYMSDGAGVQPDEWGGCLYSSKQLGAADAAQ